MVQADSWLSLKINKKRDIFSHFYYNKCGVKHFLKLLFTWIESCFKQKLKTRKKGFSKHCSNCNIDKT